MLENGFILKAEGREYTVLELLGRGASACAYLARCESGGLEYRCILKEYSPMNGEITDEGKERFIASGRAQNEIRGLSNLNNQTPPVSHIFEADGTAYIDVVCFGGRTLGKLEALSLPQYMAICRTVAKTAGYYHRAGYLCLDLKPENIFVMQNAPDDTVTQIVEFIDFDSVREVGDKSYDTAYTAGWAAPEQLKPYPARAGKPADIYAVGEIVFFLLFGRHSTDSEHRGFSRYPFDECREEYRRILLRPDIRGLFTRLFRGTIRSSAANRFSDMEEAVVLLDELVRELGRKDYVIPVLPAVLPEIVGREGELSEMNERLRKGSCLFLTGVGGIGKTTLLKNYIARYRGDYDVIVYLEFDGDIRHTFCDDMQLGISTAERQEGETAEEYFARKLKVFKSICSGKRVIFVLDNFYGLISKDLSRLIDCGYDTIIASRNKPPRNSLPCMEVGAISDSSELMRLVALNTGKSLGRDEKLCFEEIAELVQGHTLVLELIARQTAAGRIDARTALLLIKQNGFSRFSDEKVGSYKDGEEVYDTLSAVISALFDKGDMSGDEKLAMKCLSLLDVRGLETRLIGKFFPEIPTETLMELSRQGWLNCDQRVRIHPVIAEAVQHWEWVVGSVEAMEKYRMAADIYAGMTNAVHIRELLREAEAYCKLHPGHMVRGIYHDMTGCYYDTLLNGRYIPFDEEEEGLLNRLVRAMERAVAETERSKYADRDRYIARYCLSLASVLMRGAPEGFDRAKGLLLRAKRLILTREPEMSENRCYLLMAIGWYYTLVEPDIGRMRAFTERAEEIANRVFGTELELTDIIHIPTANCLFYHGELEEAAKRLDRAARSCGKYPDDLTYIDKRAELLCCMAEVYDEMGDREKCREVIAEVDRINDRLADQGIFRRINDGIRDRCGR